jgi:hypothetical protein
VVDREDVIAELRRLAALTKDAERERTLLSLAKRLEAGDKVGGLDDLLIDPGR